MELLSGLVIKYRWLIILGFVGFSAIIGLQIPRAHIDPDFESMIPKSMGYRASTEKIEEIFGGSDMLIILFEADDVLNPSTLRRIKKISRKVNRIPGVDRVMSLFDLKSIKGENGMMIVDPAVKRIPRNEDEKEKLRREIIDNDLVYKIVVSDDFKVTTIIAMLADDASNEEVFSRVREIVAEYPGDEKVSYAGMPYYRVRIANDINRDMSILMSTGMLLMFGFLFLAFRQLRGVVLPFVVVLMSVLVSMGMIPLFGWKITVLTVLVPVIMIAVANDYGIHLIARFQEDNVEGNRFTRNELARRMFSKLSRPVFLAGLTTIVGMLSLMMHILIPARQVGVIAAIGILYALAASLLFIPAVTTLLPIPKPVFHHDYKKKHVLDRLLLWQGRMVTKRPRVVIIVGVIFTLLVSTGIFLLQVDANPESYYSEKDPITQSTALINKRLGGSQNISLVITGDIKDPGIMKKIDAYEQALAEFPEVGNTVSIARVVKQMSRALNDPGDPYYNKIPDDRNAIAQYFELYSMSGDPDDFEQLVDFPYENAQISARIKSMSQKELHAFVAKLQRLTADDEQVTHLGGFALIFLQLADLMIRGQMLSLFIAVILVALLLMLLFRSVRAGIVAVTPIVMAMMVLFGLMGFLGIRLNIATTMLSSIMVGVGIDYTIHFLWRCKDELAAGHDFTHAVRTTLTTTGRGITFNALSVVIGFSALLISNFMPVRFFGFLVFVSILACLAGAMIFVPAVVMAFKPSFLQKVERQSRKMKD